MILAFFAAAFFATTLTAPATPASTTVSTATVQAAFAIVAFVVVGSIFIIAASVACFAVLAVDGTQRLTHLRHTHHACRIIGVFIVKLDQPSGGVVSNDPNVLLE